MQTLQPCHAAPGDKSCQREVHQEESAIIACNPACSEGDVIEEDNHTGAIAGNR